MKSPLKSEKPRVGDAGLGLGAYACLLYVGMASDNWHVNRGMVFPYLCPVRLDCSQTAEDATGSL